MLNKKQLVALIVLVSISITASYLYNHNLHAGKSQYENQFSQLNLQSSNPVFTGPSSNTTSNFNTTVTLPAGTQFPNRITIPANESGTGHSKMSGILGGIGISAGVCGTKTTTKKTYSSVAICAWACTPQGCQIKQIITTIYYPITAAAALGSGLTPITEPTSYSESPVAAVQAYNYNSAPYFLTCPEQPNAAPTNQLYFYSGYEPGAVGDACMNTYLGPLTTTMTFNIEFIGGPAALISNPIGSLDLIQATMDPPQIKNPGFFTTNVLTYSPEVDNSLSDAFSTQFYIFQHSPSLGQHSIWTFTGDIVNFSNVVQSASVSDTFPAYFASISIGGISIPIGCVYSYTYTANIQLKGISNGYIPFNVIVGGAWGQQPYKQIQFEANVLPFFYYNYSLQAPYGQNFNMSYDIFDPLTYGAPYNSIDEFPLDSSSLFFAAMTGGVKNTPVANLGKTARDNNGQGTFLLVFNSTGMGANALVFANVLVSGAPSTSPTSVNGCPNQDYNGDLVTELAVPQVIACAVNAGFSGQQLEIAIAIASPESSNHPGEHQGFTYTYSQCAAGILQEGWTPCITLQNGDTSPTVGASDNLFGVQNKCSTYATDKDGTSFGGQSLANGVWYNPTCAYEWAYAEVQANGFGAFWGSYAASANPNIAEAYCAYMPTAYTGYGCESGGEGQALAGGQPMCSYQGLAIGTHYHVNFPDCESTSSSPSPTPTPGPQPSPSSSPSPGPSQIPASYVNSSVNSSFSMPNYAENSTNSSSLDQNLLASSSGSVTSQEIWTALIRNGATPMEASGIMGNMAQETGVSVSNPSSVEDSHVECGLGSPAYPLCIGTPASACTGLVCWTSGFGYPAGYCIPPATCTNEVVTGNPQTDLSTQITLLDGTGAFSEASGANPTAAAFSFMTNYEKCDPSKCNPSNRGAQAVIACETFSGLPQSQCTAGEGATPPVSSPGSGSSSSPQSVQIPGFNAIATRPPPTFYNLANPISIAATTTGYVYVLNFSPDTPEACHGGCVGDKVGAYYLNIFRVWPKGSYNMSRYPPNAIGTIYCRTPASLTALCHVNSQWNQAWDQYWSNTILMQQNQTQFVTSIDLTKLTGGGAQLESGRLTGTYPNFLPLNISVSDTGNVFIIGANTIACVHAATATGRHCSFFNTGFVPEIIKISNTVVANSMEAKLTITSNTLDNMPVPSEFVPEITVSPDGSLVFLAGPQNGYIYVVNGDYLYYQGAASLAFSKNTMDGYIGVNILSYFANNGLYNDSIPWVSQGATDPSTEFDTPAYHHPLGIQDINGYLYVLDDWQGQNVGGKLNFAVLLYRVINSTGFDVPINPTSTNNEWAHVVCPQPQDVQQIITSTENLACLPPLPPPPPSFCTTGCHVVAESHCTTTKGWQSFPGEVYACVPDSITTGTPTGNAYNAEPIPTQNYINLAAQSSNLAEDTYPPFGVPLSANISMGTQTVTFCADLSCTFSPVNLPSNYQGGFSPVGPRLQATGESQSIGLGFSVNENGTTTILFPSQPKKPTSWWSPCHLSWGLIGCPKTFLTTYFELLFLNFNVQNYTNYQVGDGAYQCFIGNTLAAAGSVCSGGSDTQNYYSNNKFMRYLTNMTSPIYFFNDPFTYLEGLGNVTPTLTYGGAFYSTFSVGKEGGISTGTNYPDCANAFGNDMQTNGCPQISNEQLIASQLQTYVNSQSLSSGPAVSNSAAQQTLTSKIWGKLFIPYQFTFTIKNLYNSIKTVTPTYFCDAENAALILYFGALNKLPASQYTVYYYTNTTSQVSTPLKANVNGGNTYLNIEGTSNLYTQNLTDYGTILPPDIRYLVQTDRQISAIYVNITPWTNQLFNNGKVVPQVNQYILNATLLYNYKVNVKYQLGLLLGGLGGFGGLGGLAKSLASGTLPAGGYATVSSTQLPNSEYGQKAYDDIACGSSSIISQLLSGSLLSCVINRIQIMQSYVVTKNGFDFSIVTAPSYVNLFSEYLRFAYANPLYLYLNSSTYSIGALAGVAGGAITGAIGSSCGAASAVSSVSGQYCLLGYNRLIYVLNDKFDNNIYVPLDADFANITQINLNVTPIISPTNPNETTLEISGRVGYTSIKGNTVPLANGDIYLYYGADINYIDFNPHHVAATTNAILCTYGFNSIYNRNVPAGSLPTAQQCQLSNPAFTGQATNADVVTFHTQSGSSGNTCGPAPNSLFVIPNTNCNIYGNDGKKAISQTCTGTSITSGTEYCIPLYTNGTGECTSQLGLIGSGSGGVGQPYLITNAQGYFRTSITVCGIGQAKIIAKFYGTPLGQPALVAQSLLPYSADPSIAPIINQESSFLGPVGGTWTWTTFNVINFYWAPNQTAQTVNIGLFELGIGSIGAIAAVIVVVCAVFVLAYIRQQNKSKKAKNRRGGKK